MPADLSVPFMTGTKTLVNLLGNDCFTAVSLTLGSGRGSGRPFFLLIVVSTEGGIFRVNEKTSWTLMSFGDFFFLTGVNFLARRGYKTKVNMSVFSFYNNDFLSKYLP